MKTIKILIYLIIQIIFINHLSGQISGRVTDINSNNDTLPLIGANVYYLNTTIGTITDNSGFFILPEAKGNNKIVFSFIGY